MALSDIKNKTPFEHFVFEKMAPGRQICDVIVLKGAYMLAPSGKLKLAPEPAEFYLADQHYGDTNTTSLWRSGDMLLHKPATDLFVSGSARPPKGMEDQWPCELIVETKDKKYRQQVHMLGPRHWQYSVLSGWHMTKPARVEHLPMRYELAFGGRYPKKGGWSEHAPNPIGLGFYDKAKMDKDIHYPAPQIQYLKHPYASLDDIVPTAGFGPIPRFWAARKRYAGTYDDAWHQQFKDQDMPDYPKDFDLKFFQGAHPDWIFSPQLRGNEWICMVGFHGDQGYRFQLPDIGIAVDAYTDQGEHFARQMQMDTVEIALDAQRVYITWRLTLPHSLGVVRAVV